MTAPVSVVEFTDPGCVWSWGSEPRLRWLRLHYGAQLRWRRVFGGQVDDLAVSHPGRDAVSGAASFRDDWLAVSAHTGAPVPEHLAWMHRSTRPAATAARAAERQGGAVADAVLRRLREAVFLAGRPADTPARLAAALTGVPGLDVGALLTDLSDAHVVASIQADFEETRRPHPAVIGRTGTGPNPGAAKPDGDRLRYGFPTLLLDGPGGEQVVAGWNGTEALEAFVIAAGATPVDTSVPLDPDLALARFGTLTLPDLQLLTGGLEPSADGAVSFHAVDHGPVWVTAATASWLVGLRDDGAGARSWARAGVEVGASAADSIGGTDPRDTADGREVAGAPVTAAN